jgi:hypothetical protein
MKIFTFKNLSKLLEIAFQAWVVIGFFYNSEENVSIQDRIDNLNNFTD